MNFAVSPQTRWGDGKTAGGSVALNKTAGLEANEYGGLEAYGRKIEYPCGFQAWLLEDRLSAVVSS